MKLILYGVMSSEKEILSIKNLSLSYETINGKIIAVNDVSLSFYSGLSYAIVGESGSGKSTLANSLIGYIKYPMIKENGSVEYNGKSIFEMNEKDLKNIRMKEISFVPQAAMNSLNPVITIGEEMKDILREHITLDSKAEKERLEKVLSIVNLPTYVLKAYPNQLSGGMKQRVIIAIAILLDPKIIILDEPTTGLDVIVQKEILETLKKINKELGTTSILITHDLGVASFVSEYIFIMYNGKILEHGDKNKIIKDPLHPYTKLLISSIPSIREPAKRLAIIPGQVKLLKEITQKCVFAERCPFKQPICETSNVEEYYTDDHYVRCLKYNNLLSSNFPEFKISKYFQEIYKNPLAEKLRVNEQHTVSLINASLTYKVGRGKNLKIIEAVKDVSLTIKAGKCIALVGGSGSGKTSIGKLLLFDEKLTSGSYTIDDVDFSKPTKKNIKYARKMIQMIFQDPYSALSPIHKVGYQLKVPLNINKIYENNEIEKTVENLFDLVGLRPPSLFINKYPHELSGGQRQRICIAKALTVGPKILVADEPVSMLDASVRAEILNLLKILKEELNIGILYITHDLSTVSFLADEIYVIKEGVILEKGDFNEILNNPQNEYTKKLIDSVLL
ncbi:MAG: ABC transporter ATP-binding protein [Thermoplasmata archaeon]